ncbi:MAG: hypothetical protein A4S09_06515 [Proteobacteria bacterium SG_bin7]|nr:MAG: hypothetical protein A4S09_06515 [Proteobacteria bacterium SG_bin7]
MIYLIQTVLVLCLSSKVFAQNVKTIKLCEKSVAPIFISHKGTVLDFPAEPEKVVLGTKNSFSIEYIRSDLAISPLTVTSKSNLFVYLHGRRFALDLSTSTYGATLYFIKDCDSDKVLVKKNGK